MKWRGSKYYPMSKLQLVRMKGMQLNVEAMLSATKTVYVNVYPDISLREVLPLTVEALMVRHKSRLRRV